MTKILKARLKEQRIVMNISPMILALATASLACEVADAGDRTQCVSVWCK
jgi:hypothetical protein